MGVSFSLVDSDVGGGVVPPFFWVQCVTNVNIRVLKGALLREASGVYCSFPDDMVCYALFCPRITVCCR